MKIAIISAMESEIKYLLEKASSYTISKYHKYTFYETKLFNKDLIITSSGIGKVASGLLVSALVAYYNDLDLLINIGISGAISRDRDDSPRIGDIIVADKLRYADVDVTVFPNYTYGQIPNCPPYFQTNLELLDNINLNLDYKVGTILSGDQFYHKKDQVLNILNKYFRNDDVFCIDMESTALAQSSWFYEIKYLAIRAISDILGSDSQVNEYNANLELAAKKSNKFLLEVLEKI